MASKMGKLGWCVHGWHPGGHTSHGVVDACIFDNQILEHFLGWSLNGKKKLQCLLGLFWSLPLVSFSLSLSLSVSWVLSIKFGRVSQKKKDAHANDSQKEIN